MIHIHTSFFMVLNLKYMLTRENVQTFAKEARIASESGGLLSFLPHAPKAHYFMKAPESFVPVNVDEYALLKTIIIQIFT